MGFYIRKAFKAGPLRINLSKGGLGVSAGVTGARIGITPRGQVYTHAGRHGLYHRQTLRSGSSPSRGRGRTPTQEVEIDTGVTYGFASPQPDSPGWVVEPPSTRRRWLGALVTAPVGFLVVVIGGCAGSGVLLAAGSVALAAAVGFAIRAALLGLRARRFHEELERITSGAVAPAEIPAALDGLVKSSKAAKRDTAPAAQRGYFELLRRIVWDGHIDQAELDALQAFESRLGLDPELIARARTEAFREGYLAAAADHELTEAEEQALAAIRQRLEVPQSAVREELAMIQRLAEVREIRSGGLRPVETSIKLRRGEQCYCETPARQLKHKVLGSFQQDGVRYKQRGFEIDKEGTLLVTSKRLLLVHQGTSSVPFDKVLDVDIDADRGVVSIVKDGRKKPVIFTMPDALKVGAIIAAVAEV